MKILSWSLVAALSLPAAALAMGKEPGTSGPAVRLGEGPAHAVQSSTATPELDGKMGGPHPSSRDTGGPISGVGNATGAPPGGVNPDVGRAQGPTGNDTPTGRGNGQGTHSPGD